MKKVLSAVTLCLILLQSVNGQKKETQTVELSTGTSIPIFKIADIYGKEINPGQLKELFRMSNEPLVFVADKSGVIRCKQKGHLMINTGLKQIVKELIKQTPKDK